MWCCWQQGWVVIDGVGACGGVAVGQDWERGRGGKDILVATSHALNICEVVDSMDGVLQLSLNWENSCRKHAQCETWSVHTQTLSI